MTFVPCVFNDGVLFVGNVILIFAYVKGLLLCVSVRVCFVCVFLVCLTLFLPFCFFLTGVKPTGFL